VSGDPARAVAVAVTAEIVSQPDCWRDAAALAAGGGAAALPRPGERVAVIGCGTSWFMAQAYAVLREDAGHGWTDAFAASELPAARRYDRVVAITRSGTTTEVLEALTHLRGRTRTVVLAGDPAAPAAGLADDTVALGFADERSVVQTRFATSALALLRATLGHDVGACAADAERALAVPVEPWTAAAQFTFLGRGWTVGLAHEAALKLREAAQAWTESYPAMDYRHGPISIAEPGRITWMFGAAPPGLSEEVTATGAGFVTDERLDPLAHLVVAQRLAVALATRRGLDPDHPRHLHRSVVLSGRAAAPSSSMDSMGDPG